MSPQGEQLNQKVVEDLAGTENLILVAGRYEGIDERLISREVDREISIGDYVLSGGELAAMVVIDAIARQIPGVLGHQESAVNDSYAGEGWLDCPHYTRPEDHDGMKDLTYFSAGIMQQSHAGDASSHWACLLYTSPSPRDATLSRMPSSA